MNSRKTYFSVVTFRNLHQHYKVINGNVECLVPGFPARCSQMGIFVSEELAIESILTNKTGFDEQWTDYCVLEEIREGFYPVAIRNVFFKFINDKEVFELVKPGESPLIDKLTSKQDPTIYTFS